MLQFAQVHQRGEIFCLTDNELFSSLLLRPLWNITEYLSVKSRKHDDWEKTEAKNLVLIVNIESFSLSIIQRNDCCQKSVKS